MAQHVWWVKKPGKNLVNMVLLAAEVGREEGLLLEEALRFAGYIVEAARQSSARFVGLAAGKDGVRARLKAASARGSKYATGINRENYLTAARNVLTTIAVRAGLRPETPLGIVGDFIQDNVGTIPEELNEYGPRLSRLGT